MADFYLGEKYDINTLRPTGEKLLLDPDDLTTHAVIIGMTGSGKTGAGIILMEEAILNNIPIIVIDPKGDAVNIALRFPNLSPEEFLPWIDVKEAESKNMSVEEYAKRISEIWRNGIVKSGQKLDKIRRICENSEILIFTPGSKAGIPISIIHDLNIPKGLNWDEHEEILLGRISNIVSALLSLAGKNPDPLESNEHVLISNILEYLWRRGEDIDFTKLLAYIVQPPFQKIGAVDIDIFMSKRERRQLVIDLNRIIASPTFKNWLTGLSLDFDEILWSPKSKPRIIVFYLAHLDQSQKMFIVTLILRNIYDWMFRKSGTSRLRMMVYFDEIYGYIPPYPRNPPSKSPLLLLLKQARAFGVGIVLSTQNPVDIDYKALSNAGIWMIGRLQTENDKNRVMDGLKYATDTAGTLLDVKTISRIISSLGKRVFLLHNVHENVPYVFKTRWALSYLRGPLTLNEIRKLSKGLKIYEQRYVSIKQPAISKNITNIPPEVPSNVLTYFLPVLYRDKVEGGLKIYYPVLVLEGRVELSLAKADIYISKTYQAFLDLKENYSISDFNNTSIFDIDSSKLDMKVFLSDWDKSFAFINIPNNFQRKRFITSLERKFKQFLRQTFTINIYYIRKLNIYSRPGESQDEFIKRVSNDIYRFIREKENNVREKYGRRIDSIRNKIASKTARLEKLQAEISSLKNQIGLGGIEIFSSILLRRSLRRRLTSVESIRSKIRLKEEESKRISREIAGLKIQLDELRNEMNLKIMEVRKTYSISDLMKTITIKPKYKDIEVSTPILLWIPLIVRKNDLKPIKNLFTGGSFSQVS